MRVLLSVLLIYLLPSSGMAAIPTLNNLNTNDFNDVMEEFSGNVIHRSASPASTAGNRRFLPWLGVELGIIGGLADAQETEKLVKKSDPNTGFDTLYHGGIFAAVSSLYGLGLELSLIPSKTISDVSFRNLSGALKWTFTDYFRMSKLANWPLDVAVKFSFADTRIRYNQDLTVNGANVDTEITFENFVWDLQVQASREFFGFVEPWVAFGFANADSDLVAKASTTINVLGFATASTEQTASTTPDSFSFNAGVQFSYLWFFKTAIQYSSVFSGEAWTAKFAVAF